MSIISQNLTVPPGLATGQIAQASQITPLYSALNNFVLPDSFGVLQQAFVDDNLTTLTVGGTTTKDWTMTTSVTSVKSMIFLIPFQWSAGSAPTLQYRMNGSVITATQATTNAATGSGMIIGYLGGRDADVPRSLFIFQMDSGATQRFVFPNADLPTADLTTFGITLAGTAGAFNFKHVRFWREG